MEGAGWSLLPPLSAPHPHPCWPFTPHSEVPCPRKHTAPRLNAAPLTSWNIWGLPWPSVISASPLWEETLRELLLIPGACEAQHRERRQTHDSRCQGTVAWQLSLASAGFSRLSHPSGRGLLLPKLHSSVSRVKAGSSLAEVTHSVKSLLCNHRA